MTEHKEIDILDLVSGRTHPTDEVTVTLDPRVLKELREYVATGGKKTSKKYKDLTKELKDKTLKITLQGLESGVLNAVTNKWTEEDEDKLKLVASVEEGITIDLFQKSLQKVETYSGNTVTIESFDKAVTFFNKLSPSERIKVSDKVTQLYLNSIVYDDEVDAGFLE